ncbi:MAG: hypothetical protein WD894_21820 [Pirellulales bacterium]
MNRRVVGYSTLGSIAVAAVAGTVYLLTLTDTQADDEGTDLRTSISASARGTSRQSQGPDPLFAEPVNVWTRDDRQPVTEPFQNHIAPAVQTAYGNAVPRRLTPDPNAVPLRQAQQQGLDDSFSPRASLEAGSEAVAGDLVAPTSERPTDPFGPQNTAHVIAAREGETTKAATGRRSASGQPPRARTELADDPVTSIYRSPPAEEGDSQLNTGEPAPLKGAATSAQAGERIETTQSSSVFDQEQGANHRPPAHVSQSQARDGARLQSVNNGFDPAGLANSAGIRPNVAPAVSSGGSYSTTGTRSSGTSAASPESPQPLANTGDATGSGRPGSRQIEGKQVPQITIEKVAPPEVQVGKPAKFELHVRNTGAVVAQNVRVRDLVPTGTEFIAANPPPNRSAHGELDWSLGALKPGDETTIEVEVMPVIEGEVGSVAVVSVEVEASARSRVTRPDLTLQVTAAKEVMIGHEVTLSIKIANPGSGPATGVVLAEHVPAGLKHAAGPELEFEVGTLKPGETRELELALTAAQAGRIVNQIAARGEGNLQAQAQCELEVIAPALEIKMDGPSRRYLERQATYTVSVSNPGTATTKDIELVTRLPRGLKFVKANNSGHYDPGTHTVIWSLEELPPSESGTVMLTAIPVEAGEQRLRAEGRAKQNLTDEQEQITLVEGVAALLFQVVDVADPIEVKGETQYEIRITNQGSKAADNVQLVALMPPELRFVSADGPTRYAVKGQQVVFEPLARLAPKADTSYRVVVQGLRPGDLRMRVQVTADDLQQPIIKEESTRVYADE